MGEGELDWFSLLSKMKEIGYDGFFSLELEPSSFEKANLSLEEGIIKSKKIKRWRKEVRKLQWICIIIFAISIINFFGYSFLRNQLEFSYFVILLISLVGALWSYELKDKIKRQDDEK